MRARKLISFIVISLLVTPFHSMETTSVVGNIWKNTSVPDVYPLYLYDEFRSSSQAMCGLGCQSDKFCIGFNFKKYSNICHMYVSLHPEINEATNKDDSQSMFVATEGGVCIEKGYVVGRHLNTCIKRSEQKKRWLSAKNECKNDQAKLMVASTQEKFDLFYHPYMYTDFQTVFVGAQNASGKWTWVDGTDVIWKNGPPSNPGESNCMDIRKDGPMGKIRDNDSSCNKAKMFMCEIIINY